MLTVAVDGDGIVESVLNGCLKATAQSRSFTPITCVCNKNKGNRASFQQVGGIICGTVVYHNDMLCIGFNLLNNAQQRLSIVVSGDDNTNLLTHTVLKVLHKPAVLSTLQPLYDMQQLLP